MNAYMFQVTKRRNSTWKPATADGYAFTLALKDTTDVVRPNFEVQGLPNPWTGNYIYVPELSRYYFIDRWEVSGPYWIAHCTVDVLASFKAQIEGTEKYILRSTSNISASVPDANYPPADGVTHTFSTKKLNWGAYWAHGFTDGYYVLGMIGAGISGAVTAGSVTYWVLTPTELSKLTRYMLSGVTSDWSDLATITSQLTKTIADPLQYIVSCMWFPYEPPTSSVYYPITFGFFNAMDPDNPAANLTGRVLASPMGSGKDVMPVAEVTGYRQDAYHQAFGWAFSEPISSYILQFNPWGVFPVPAELIAGHCYLGITVKTDFVTGVALANLYAWGTWGNLPGDANIFRFDDPTYGAGACRLLTSRSAQVGVQIQLSQNTSSFLSPIVSGFTGAVSGAGMGLAGGVVGGTAGAIAGALGGIIGSISDKYVSTGSNGGIAGDEGEITLHVFRHSLALPVDGNNVQNYSEQGSTCCKLLRIGSLSGYCQCADGELACTALADEKQMIADLLTGGFYVES